MSESKVDRVDAFTRRHPRLMFGVVIGMAMVAAVVLLASSQENFVLYQVF